MVRTRTEDVLLGDTGFSMRFWTQSSDPLQQKMIMSAILAHSSGCARRLVSVLHSVVLLVTMRSARNLWCVLACLYSVFALTSNSFWLGKERGPRLVRVSLGPLVGQEVGRR